jgi:hypothetical protein
MGERYPSIDWLRDELLKPFDEVKEVISVPLRATLTVLD